MADGSWIDQDKSSYDYNLKHGNSNVRILYLQPKVEQEPVAVCGMCGYTGSDTDGVGQCPKCRWDELTPLQDTSLRSALNGMLTQFGMDEDEWSRPVFDKARAALAHPETQKGIRVWGWVWKDKLHEDCYVPSYTPAQHVPRGELFALVDPSDLYQPLKHTEWYAFTKE